MDFDFKQPALAVYDLIYRSKTDKNAADRLRSLLTEKAMYDLYIHLVEKNLFPKDQGLQQALLEKKTHTLTLLEAQKEKDPDNETYILSVDKQVSEFYAQTMDVKNACETMRALMEADSSLSLKMDVFLCRIRMGVILRNKRLVEDNIVLAEDVYCRGSDWDRRNKYKVYKAVYSMMKTRFAEAAILFSEALPSFESPEIISYPRAVLYLMFCGLLTFDRKDINNRILECSEVLSSGEVYGSADKERHGEWGEVLRGLELARCLFDCNYCDFMGSLHAFCASVQDDVFVGRFVDFFCKEMKLRAYRQILESYQSMSLGVMAKTFGVDVGFVERDLSRLIVEGRMFCMIDRVSGIVDIEEKACSEVESVVSRGGNVVRKVKKYIK